MRIQNLIMQASSNSAWDAFKNGVTSFSNFLWSGPLTILLLGTGLFLTVITAAICIRRVPAGFKTLFNKSSGSEGEISPFQALATALAATVGTGNIVGVATAIGIGGPGAVFWMWIVAILGITTKYAESLLAVHFRTQDKAGAYVGGPMYYIERGMGPKWKWLAVTFACGALFAAFVTGNMIQANAVAGAVSTATAGMVGESGIPGIITGGILAAATFAVIIGGIKGIGKVAEKLIPAMAVIYIILAAFIVITNYQAVPGAFASIFEYAFTGKAATGGFVGAMIIAAIRAGVARGLFSNEAGQGSAPMAHAAATVKDPVSQARIGMLGTVIDTLIICTMTALVILTLPGLGFTSIAELGDGTFANFQSSDQKLSLALYNGANMTKDDVSTLTSIAFTQALPGGAWIIAIAMVIFSFTTVLGWSYYGERALAYLTGATNFMIFRILWCAAVWFGAMQEVDFIWRLGDVASAAMTAPNLIALLALSGVVVKLTKDYEKKPAS
ncbi:MAG: alanine/glycine:cation symporter family protein [Maricaulaceae bacterium]